MKLIDNKKLTLTYSPGETFESGIELLGFEVKSIKAHLGSLDGSKVIIRGGEAYLVGSYIPPYQAANTPKSYDPFRTRKLLLHKEEIMKLLRATETNKLTIHPISLYSKASLIKCDVALCTKKTKGDKRENIKKDIARREMREK